MSLCVCECVIYVFCALWRMAQPNGRDDVNFKIYYCQVINELKVGSYTESCDSIDQKSMNEAKWNELFQIKWFRVVQ